MGVPGIGQVRVLGSQGKSRVSGVQAEGVRAEDVTETAAREGGPKPGDAGAAAGHSRGGRGGADAASGVQRGLRRPPAASRHRGRAGASPGPSASAGSRRRGEPPAAPRAAPAEPAAPAARASRSERGAGRGTRYWAPLAPAAAKPRLGAAPRVVPAAAGGHFREGLVPAAGAMSSLWEVAFALFVYLFILKLFVYLFIYFPRETRFAPREVQAVSLERHSQVSKKSSKFNVVWQERWVLGSPPWVYWGV